jgi:hypothetical protein
MFWLIVAAVVVVGFWIAWWSSGRAKGAAPPGDDRHRREADLEQKYGNSPGRGGIMPPTSGS